jgi:hypothetical protein
MNDNKKATVSPSRPLNCSTAADQHATLVCVLCGATWIPHLNVCKNCKGICNWGYEKGGKPLSWKETENGWIPKPPPNEVSRRTVEMTRRRNGQL